MYKPYFFVGHDKTCEILLIRNFFHNKHDMLSIIVTTNRNFFKYEIIQFSRMQSAGEFR